MRSDGDGRASVFLTVYYINIFFFLMLNSWILRLGMAETYRYVPTVLLEIAGSNAGGLQCLFYSVPPNKNILSIKTFQAVVRFL